MKKPIILIISILLLTGCSSNYIIEQEEYVDKDTCVVYLTRYHGGISPMYNQDGTLKLDKKCMKEGK